MRVRALRGVCIGVEQYLEADDVEDLDPATGQFLISIGAVALEEVKQKAAKAKTAEAKSETDAASKSASADADSKEK